MKAGYFGTFGGQYVPELLMPPLLELERALSDITYQTGFQEEFNQILTDYVGRPSPFFLCRTLSKELGFDVWLKREDLNHTGSYEINNSIGQALLTKYMGKRVLLTDTGAGQQGVAAATAAALMGLECVVFMGAWDMQRQLHNVRRIRLLGAHIEVVESGTQTLKDAISETFRFWIAEQKTTHYCMGSIIGPHPFPTMVRDFQAVIGTETREQIQKRTGKLPDIVVSCVSAGTNAMGMFHAFIPDDDVRLVAVEGAGSGDPGIPNCATLEQGEPGVLHGAYTLLLQTEDGQIRPSHSVAPGLDYPGVGPELAYLRNIGRVENYSITDKQALRAYKHFAEKEGIIVALESCHALGWILDHASDIPSGSTVVVNLSGCGDKDMDIFDYHSKANSF